MNQLRSVELKLINDLFGINFGYVLDFTNATFADFFRSEIGVNMFDDAKPLAPRPRPQLLGGVFQEGQPVERSTRRTRT